MQDKSEQERETTDQCCIIMTVIGGLTLLGVIAIIVKCYNNNPVQLETDRKYIGYVKER